MTCCKNKKTRADYRLQASIHKALANEARLMIVEQLESGDRGVGELAKAVDLDISTVSKHLSVLLNAGIVANEKNGNQVRYRLLTPCILDMFACTADVLNGNAAMKRGERTS